VKLYIIGSLRNPKVTEVASALRKAGFDVFDDWYAAGPDADDAWRDYEKARGRTYLEALGGYAARHVFEFDKYHLDRADAAVLVAPAGKSAHLELGYMIGRGRPGFILLDPEVERWDVMYQFATGLVDGVDELVQMIKERNMTHFRPVSDRLDIIDEEGDRLRVDVYPPTHIIRAVIRAGSGGEVHLEAEDVRALIATLAQSVAEPVPSLPGPPPAWSRGFTYRHHGEE